MSWLWIAFAALILFLLWLDLFVFHRHSRVISTREALSWSVFWVVLGLTFAGVVYLVYEHHLFGAELGRTPREVVRNEGLQAVVRYLTGYLLEKSLSIDNLFVISLIFTALKVHPQYQHRVLFWGILGALVMRSVMITGGIWLVTRFTWMFYAFGAVLIYSGLNMLRTSESEDVSSQWWMRMLQRVFPVAGVDGGRFLVRQAGRLHLTPLALALLAVETADLIFAVDSVPAILGVTTEPFLVVTSNVFAILGLRSLYFVLAGMIRQFKYLEAALSILLVIIGIKMVAHHYFPIPNLISLLVIVVVVTSGVVISLLSRRRSSDD